MAVAWGGVSYGPNEDEKKSLIFRRSLYIAEDMKRGDVLTTDNLRCVRPELGLDPKYWKLLIGKSVKRNVTRATPFEWAQSDFSVMPKQETNFPGPKSIKKGSVNMNNLPSLDFQAVPLNGTL